ncbi:hypothetical protein B1B04_22230 [Lysinibacillus sp. KCTC 33748]|uniref:DUF1883 domain-containing protein n=1 Tax=unclassified Lysinibacillus TaxID=2636778 RepID=UPI0009A654FA|nr:MULTISPECIES: DUF1883 domain-containing protein [unclassified Lysinibacillus]OXS67512.1 hypothetical protein B1B04_22230 [Lysinibacillus sp. KCTC 33748]SKC14366.1 protein of unknown function [Lysinibacillus sp. AC-3]
MTQIPYAHSNGHLSVKVDLKHAAEVFLVDSINFNRYESGLDYTYHGGYYTETPVTINVKGVGRWYLIVNNDGEYYNYSFY